LDATQGYYREVKRTQGDIPESVKNLLSRLRNAEETAIILVALAEATPVYEAMRLEEDLSAQVSTPNGGCSTLPCFKRTPLIHCWLRRQKRVFRMN